MAIKFTKDSKIIVQECLDEEFKSRKADCIPMEVVIEGKRKCVLYINKAGNVQYVRKGVKGSFISWL